MYHFTRFDRSTKCRHPMNRTGPSPELQDGQPEAFPSRLDTRSRSKQRKNRPKATELLLPLWAIVLIWLAPWRGIAERDLGQYRGHSSAYSTVWYSSLRRSELVPVKNAFLSRIVISSQFLTFVFTFAWF